MDRGAGRAGGAAQQAGWLRVPPALRVVAVLVGLGGVQLLLVPTWFFLVPVDTPAFAIATGVLSLVAAVGILRAARWARVVGVITTLGWLLAAIILAAWTFSREPDPLLGLWVTTAQGLFIGVYALMLIELLMRWPHRVGTGGGRRSALGLVILVAVALVAAMPPVERTDLAPPAPPEPPGPLVGRGRVEMRGSGFAITLPASWTVEIADPDPALLSAASGDAWEALRAYGPERREACSVFVAVAREDQPSLEESSGVGTSGAAEPRWSTEDGRPILLVRPPWIDTGSGGGLGTIAPRERLRSSDPSLAHDVLYAVVCETAENRDLDGIIRSLEFLPGDT